MTAPTPAAVRAAMKISQYIELTDEEKRAFLNDPRIESGILRDHIRAVAEEMRKESEEWYAASLKHGGNKAMTDHANDLEKFADRLEGRES